jgi:uncharacterized membrane protein
MSSVRISGTHPPGRLLKYSLFGLIGFMMLIVLYRERVLLDPQAPIWDHYSVFKWWLLPHGLTGALALFLAPLQFSNTLRRRFLNWHRFIGRAYVTGVALAAPLGAWIEYIKYVHGIAPLRLLIASTGFATLFLVSTAIGFSMIRRHKIQAHRRWMTRSYAIALVFLEVRVVDQTPWLQKITKWPSTMLESHSVSDLWMFIVFSVACAELVLLTDGILKRQRSVIPIAGAHVSA